MRSSLLGNNYRYAAVFLSVIVTLFMVYGLVSGATTISTNITTAGTLTVSGASTLTGNVTAAGTLAVTGNVTHSALTILTGAVNASSTVNTDGNLTVAGRATTTAANGNFAVAGTIGSGTTTPQAGDIAANTVTATTTLYLAAANSTRGSCIQLESSTGSPYRLYVGETEYATVTGVVGKGGYIAIWESGTCK